MYKTSETRYEKNDYYLSIDIGASSGRHIISWLDDNGRIQMKEIYRFENGMTEENGHLYWDMDRLFDEVVKGMKLCKAKNCIPKSVGIDTWAVDYVLLDKYDVMIGKCYGYRDFRTEGMDKKVDLIISPEELYKRTGIQKQIFNTIYQLMEVRVNSPRSMERADSFLMIPDYLAFLLTGVKGNEYTNATTTQLVSPFSKSWDHMLIGELGFKDSIFGEIHMPGSVVGKLRKKTADLVGYDTTVIRVATHDTASAVAAVPSPDKDCIYISSGTWSLMGVELDEANLTEEGMKANLTNEGGYNFRFRYLKNIMGLWMIQSLKKECAPDMSYAQLCELAEQCSDFDTVVDVNDASFFAPESMKDAIDGYCGRAGLEKPEKLGEYATLIYRSLAMAYRDTLEEIESITGKKYDRINVVGGGANASYLNELTARMSGREVLAGPTEATAIGNLLIQLIADGKFSDLKQARECVRDSFEIKRYLP